MVIKQVFCDRRGFKINKCKNCDCHDYLETKGLGFNGDYRSRGHWCMYQITIQTPDKIKMTLFDHKYMKYKEFISVPNWCPKKLTSYIYDGIECKVLNIKSRVRQ